MATTGNGSNGSNPLSQFDIQAPNFTEQGKAWGIGEMASGWVDDLIRKHILSHASGGAAILSSLASMIDDFLAVAVQFFDAAQAGGQPGFFTLLASVLGGVLGTEINADLIAAAWKRGGDHSGFTAVGQAYWGAMMKQLGNPQTLTPDTGLASAQGFIGYMLGFAIRQGNLAFIDSVLPEELRVVDGIEEYGHMMQRNLGLGRMAHTALLPMIQTLISDPLKWYVNNKYKPKLLGEGPAVQMYTKGLIDLGTLNQELAYAGYSDARIQQLIAHAWGHVSLNDAWELYKMGQYDSQALYAVLQENGFNPHEFEDWIQARIQAEIDPWQVVLLHDWVTERAAGTITTAQLMGYIDDLTYPQAVKERIKNAYGQLYENPRKRLTLAEMQSALTEGLIDSDALQTYLTDLGYSQDDAQILWYQSLLKLGTQQAKMAVAQYTWDKAKARAAKAGEPPPPPPAILAEQPTGNPLPPGL